MNDLALIADKQMNLCIAYTKFKHLNVIPIFLIQYFFLLAYFLIEI